MKTFVVAALLALAAPSLWAAPKDCEALKQEIEVKIQSTGATSYTLEIVPAAEVKDPNMVVGSCAYGTRKIIYQRNG
ncbi:DUF1161 domain-containing protein [Pseudomonas sp. RIT-PI-AD]|uniref:DUF1161 domain-containing protein n=1 Tax=Pseudomonas sp. RIT-PI-AD TaxID=3035294 RepID=UPI0021D80BC3|nr:DUF1161 domain-containing protein [Pseudomonas sp. RIT-PI-AD]